MESHISFNVEIAPGRVVVLTLAVSQEGVAAYAARHVLVDPYLSAWRPSRPLSFSPPAQDVLDVHADDTNAQDEPAAGASKGLVRRVEVTLKVAAGDGGWSDCTMEEEFE
ncbi:hypothetical protein FA95DRAFT_1613727 [Auriscalpium vulgare]|uniref:Uncharacterized protein n=1 Tax=Auriscalpium vulgare TaxID=40419 RepID=A0ACB8R1H7_9AGAM|nr:hypothetical protein FA95DRAFT_1613727 [Auriscalpium vulgare]